MYFRCPNQQGYTLIEVMMTVTLVAILSAIGVSQYIDFSSEAKRAVTVDRLQQLKFAITGNPKLISQGRYTYPGFSADVGSLPGALTDLTTQGAYPAYDPFTHRGWNGPYISDADSNWSKDGWGTAFVYNSGARTITSCGVDLTCGNADDVTLTF
jgi:prepilin-type N-terminal cleavage/methylation domain-containing protein